MTTFIQKYRSYLLTATIVLIAIFTLAYKYHDYITNPWTRDGQVRANVMQITPQVSGEIIELPIKNNQFVKAGELLFAIDPRSYEASLEQAKADLAHYQAMHEAMDKDNPKIRAAQAAVTKAKLNLEFTRVVAPVDGYVTSLNLRLHSQVVANQAIFAFIDSNSYWVSGFFKENLIANICAGNRAMVTLMSYPDSPITGVVSDIGWGIAQQTGSTGLDLLPTINPTFEWIRLAQRIPVNIKLDHVPENVALRVGTTASVMVYSKKCYNGTQK